MPRPLQSIYTLATTHYEFRYRSRFMWYWSLELILKAKVESRKQKIQYGRQVTILKVTSLKVDRLLPPMATINMHMNFEIEISKQTWVMLWKLCRLQTVRQTRWFQYNTPPPP